MFSLETNSYAVSGGRRLKGSVTINASKNSAVAVLIASLLNEGKTIIKNLPKIQEVFRIIEVMNSLGVKTVWGRDHECEIVPPKKINLNKINRNAAEKTRSIILFIGPLVHRFKNFFLPSAGGCKLGRRTIMPHIYALEELGIKIESQYHGLKITNNGLHSGKKITMYESSDTATENAIMAASLIPGKTIIKFASANYQVQDLCFFLKKAGVKIEGVGTTTLIINGRKKIKKNISYYLTEDPIESMFFLSAAIVTKSSIIIRRCPLEFLELELEKLKKMGFKFKLLREYKTKNGNGLLADIKTFPSTLSSPTEKIHPQPFPGINIDNLPFFVPIATQAAGRTLIHDWVYEDRVPYYIELNRLGAKITLADAHRIFIEGPTKFVPAEVVCPPALRPSAIILIAMLAAKGESVLRNTYVIERGYEDLCGRLRKMGAKITKIK